MLADPRMNDIRVCAAISAGVPAGQVLEIQFKGPTVGIVHNCSLADFVNRHGSQLDRVPTNHDLGYVAVIDQAGVSMQPVAAAVN